MWMDKKDFRLMILNRQLNMKSIFDKGKEPGDRKTKLYWPSTQPVILQYLLIGRKRDARCG